MDTNGHILCVVMLGAIQRGTLLLNFFFGQYSSKEGRKKLSVQRQNSIYAIAVDEHFSKFFFLFV